MKLKHPLFAARRLGVGRLINKVGVFLIILGCLCLLSYEIFMFKGSTAAGGGGGRKSLTSYWPLSQSNAWPFRQGMYVVRNGTLVVGNIHSKCISKRGRLGNKAI